MEWIYIMLGFFGGMVFTIILAVTVIMGLVKKFGDKL